MDDLFNDFTFTELNNLISQQLSNQDSNDLTVMDIVFEEDDQLMSQFKSQEAGDIDVMLFEMIKLKRENNLLSKTVSMLECKLRTKANPLRGYFKSNQFMTNIQTKDNLMRDKLNINPNDKHNEIFFLDGRKKKVVKNKKK
jgi:hypothetical protein